jgi:hypothetical protein
MMIFYISRVNEVEALLRLIISNSKITVASF